MKYDDANTFRCPIKKRHRKDVLLHKEILEVSKDLTDEDFLKFRNELRKTKYGNVLAALATLQFYYALRISEAAGIQFENIKLNEADPTESMLTITHSVRFRRRGGAPPELVIGYKNSRASGGAKKFTLVPETYNVFKELFHPWSKGSVFMIDKKLIHYRSLQHYYNKAFERAGLKYRATHILRHGGCNFYYNMTGDLSVANEVLGNSDMKTVQVYAVRNPKVVKGLIKDRVWTESLRLVATNGYSVMSEKTKASDCAGL